MFDFAAVEHAAREVVSASRAEIESLREELKALQALLEARLPAGARHGQASNPGNW